MTQTKGDLDIEAEHKRWRQFEIAPIRSAEDAKLEGYDFRCIQQRTSSQNVECMPFHYYCELKSVRFDSVFFRSTSSAPEYTSNPAADEELDDDEIEIEDFPIYDQAIFEDQGFLTDFPSGEEVLDILETCTRTGCMLSMTEFEEEILEMMPMLKSIEKRIKKVDICKIRFGHLDPEKRKPLQSTFEAWLRGLIEDNGLLQLRLEEVSLGGRARPDKSLEDVPEEDEEAEPPENEEEPEETLLDWKAYLGEKIQRCQIPRIDVGFADGRRMLYDLDFMKTHLEILLKTEVDGEYAYRVAETEVDKEKFVEVCSSLGFKKAEAEEDVIEFRLSQDGYRTSVRLYAFIVTIQRYSLQ